MSSLSGTLNLEVTNETRRRVALVPLRRVVRRAKRVLKLPTRTSVQLAFVAGARMRDLNRQVQGVDRPTDVLAFPLHDPRSLRRVPRDPDGEMRLGDIVIALDTAQRQAKAKGIPLARELSGLFAHGLLHLLGYDHKKKTDAKRMEALTTRLIGRPSAPLF